MEQTERTMPTIKTEHGHTKGVSDCGRLVYRHNEAGVVCIDGRHAWRGNFINPQTGLANGGAVDPSDWSAACALMQATDAADRAYSDALRDAVYAEQSAREEALIEREAWMRKHTRGTYMDDGTF